MSEKESSGTVFKVLIAGVVVLGGIYIVSKASQPIQQPVQQTPVQRDALESIVSGAIRGFGAIFSSSNSNDGSSPVPPRPSSSSNNPGPNQGSSSYPPSGGWSFSGGNNINNWQSYS